MDHKNLLNNQNYVFPPGHHTKNFIILKLFGFSFIIGHKTFMMDDSSFKMNALFIEYSKTPFDIGFVS